MHLFSAHAQLECSVLFSPSARGHVQFRRDVGPSNSFQLVFECVCICSVIGTDHTSRLAVQDYPFKFDTAAERVVSLHLPSLPCTPPSQQSGHPHWLLGTGHLLLVTGVCSEQEKRPHYCRCGKLLGDTTQLEEKKSTIWLRKRSGQNLRAHGAHNRRAADRGAKIRNWQRSTGICCCEGTSEKMCLKREHRSSRSARTKRSTTKVAQINETKTNGSEKVFFLKKKTRSRSGANGKLGLCDDLQAKVRNVKLT